MKKRLRLGLVSIALLTTTTAFGIETGETAPQFSLPKLSDNTPIALTDYADKVIYLDFWASWCAPCRTSFPLLNGLFKKYRNQGLEVVAINLDEDPEAAQRFIKEFPVDFTVLRDAAGEWAETYRIESMPTSFIIDRSGAVQLVHSGFAKADIDELEHTIISLLKRK